MFDYIVRSMFCNIGGKIKSLAKTVCILGIAISAILGLALVNKVGFAGIVVIVIGSLISWVGSFCLYGFGELIDTTTEIAENTRCSNTTNETIS